MIDFTAGFDIRATRSACDLEFTNLAGNDESSGQTWNKI